MKDKRQIPADIENAINNLIYNLQQYPPTEKNDFSNKLQVIVMILDNNKINTADLLTFLFKAKTMEWLLHIALQFKQEHAPNDPELNNIVLAVTELLLINIKAAILLNFGLQKLPENLPDSILKNSNPDSLGKKLDNKFNQFFDLYVIKKTGENNAANRALQFDFFTKTAKQRIQEEGINYEFF